MFGMHKDINRAWINGAFAGFTDNDDFLIRRNHFIGVRDGRIAALAPMEDFPRYAAGRPGMAVHDLEGQLVIPGLIDCHSHLIYGKSRADEFERRMAGESYQSIAKGGGGILSTINDVRAMDVDALTSCALKRLKALHREGVTVAEVKSGYGLDTETELKMLQAAQKLDEASALHVEKTFLPLHAVPPEFADRPDDYVDYVCREMFDAVMEQGIATAVDAFCESIAFDIDQCRRLFDKAKSCRLPIKLHTEQLSHMGGAALAARYGALSVDHVEYIKEEDAAALAASGTAAVLLPGAYYFLKERTAPPVDLLRRHGVPMALATDLNPGTSPLCSIHLMMNLAVILFGLTPPEALKGVTLNAARALGLSDRKGSLDIGKDADFCVCSLDHPRELSCQFDPANLKKVVIGGEPQDV